MRHKDDLRKLEEVCRDLENENKGFQARINFWCCQTCGHGAMENNGVKNYIFAHEQSMERAFPVEYETRYYDEFGNDCDCCDEYADTDEVEVSRANTLDPDGLYFHHHFEDESLKRRVVSAFNNAGFLVEWDGMSDSSALKILDAK